MATRMWDKTMRQARAATIVALDTLAGREGVMPSNDAGAAVKDATSSLVNAKKALDRYLDQDEGRPRR